MGLFSWALLAATVLCFATTVLVAVWLAVSNPNGIANCHTSHNGQALLYPALCVAIAPLSMWMTCRASTPHIMRVALYLLLNWASTLLYALGQLSYCDTPFYAAVAAQGFTLLQLNTLPFYVFLSLAVIMSGYDLAVMRVEALEANALTSFRIGLLRPLLRLIVPCALLASVGVGVLPRALLPGLLVLGAAALFACPIWLVGIVVLCRALVQALRLSRKTHKSAPPWALPLTARVHHAIVMEVLAISVSTGSSVIRLLIGVSSLLVQRDTFIVANIIAVLDILCNSFLALLVSGSLSGAIQGSSRRARLAKQRLRRRIKTVAAWQKRPQRQLEQYIGWDGVVTDLAGRGLSLSALLSFWKQLPEIMPHYDSEIHTTGDVVGQAIIPFTSSRGCSGTDILMEGKVVRPDIMVTHAWGNLFRDLVAAIAADAFGENEYLSFSGLLDQDISRLETWVESAGVGQRTYWICAFAVNQHRAICSPKSTRRDRITGQLVPSCHCGVEKAENDTPPLLPDGRGVSCEMNKFDDMIRFLAAQNPNFAQVVPIDAHFQTFTRAWCIAEMATASSLGMSQDIKIGSASELDEHKEELRKLRIQDMQASRQEDKEAILASIEDHDSFNASVQSMIFEDLIPKWDTWDAEQQMACAGRLMRWQGTPAWNDVAFISELSTDSARNSRSASPQDSANLRSSLRASRRSRSSHMRVPRSSKQVATPQEWGATLSEGFAPPEGAVVEV